MAVDAKKILLATDLSETSLRARSLAQRFAAAAGAELHLLYVNVVPSAIHHASDVDARALEDFIRITVDACSKVLAEMPDEKGFKVHRVVRTDASSTGAILRYAEEEEVDLIVVGTHGLSGVKRMLLGSVAAKVVRAARVSVLVAGRSEGGSATGGEARIDHVVAATDLSDHSRAAVTRAAALAAQHGAAFTVLHVMVLPVLNPYYGLGSMTRIPDPSVGREALAEFLSELVLDTTPQQEVAVGVADLEISAAVERLQADLLVVGACGLSAVSRVLLGSIADRVVRGAPCPVLVVRAPAG